MTVNFNKILTYSFFQQLKALPFIDKIILRGSRARGDERERSDIDLAIACPLATKENWLEILEVISHPDTLLKIDCVRIEMLSETSSLKEEIQKEGIVLYQKDKKIMTPKLQHTLSNLNNVLNKLEIMLARPQDSDRANVDASIQRFEFSVEFFWELLKKIMEQLGKETSFPLEIIQEAYAGKLIDDEEVWLEMLQDKNQTSHTYDEALADQIYAAIKTQYYPVMRKTLERLSKKPPLSS